jgi:predicted Zn-dependent protease with MMP-like domain
MGAAARSGARQRLSNPLERLSGEALTLERAHFRRLVREAVALIPPELLRRVDNVDIVVESRPTARDRKAAGIGPGHTLLGLYHGIPLTRRGDNYNLVSPDKISIYQEPIEDMCADDDEIVEQVRKTVLHELGHYFGISDERLDELGMG